jgi:hypothetical protein
VVFLVAAAVAALAEVEVPVAVEVLVVVAALPLVAENPLRRKAAVLRIRTNRSSTTTFA